MKYVISLMLVLVLFSGTLALFGYNIGTSYSTAMGVLDSFVDRYYKSAVKPLASVIKFVTNDNLTVSSFYVRDDFDTEFLSDEPAFDNVEYMVLLPTSWDLIVQNSDMLNYICKDAFGFKFTSRYSLDFKFFLAFDIYGRFLHVIILYQDEVSYSDSYSYFDLSYFLPYSGICEAVVQEDFYSSDKDKTPEERITRYRLYAEKRGSLLDGRNSYND